MKGNTLPNLYLNVSDICTSLEYCFWMIIRFFDNFIIECPVWNFDGSSTYQAEGKNSDVYLQPIAIFPDPFRAGKNKLVLCETSDFEMNPTSMQHCYARTLYKCKGIESLFSDANTWKFSMVQDVTTGWLWRGSAYEFQGDASPGLWEISNFLQIF